MGELVQRRPGVGIYQRGTHMVQFGLDATRVGVIDIMPAGQVARVLTAASAPRTVEDLRRQLVHAGVEPAAVSSLIEDLLTYGILIPAERQPLITVLGDSPLADAVRAALRRDGFTVRGPQDLATAAAYVATSLADAPVLLVDCAHAGHDLSPTLLKHVPTWMPLQEIDHRLVVGPFHRGGTGPCLLCANLYRADIDPQWPHLVSQSPLVSSAPDPVQHAFFSAYAVAVARHLTGLPAPPGAAELRYSVGEVLELELYGLPQRRFLEPHPRCPVCFAHTHAAHAVSTWVDAPF